MPLTPRGGRFSVLAVISAVLAVVMAVAYVSVMRSQDDDPLAWVTAVLIVAAALAGYGAFGGAPYRRTALVAAATAPRPAPQPVSSA